MKEESNEQKSFGKVVTDSFKELFETFAAFLKAPRALWGVNVPYFIEGLVYFGILTVLTKYLSENAGMGDIKAGIVVGFFTGGITLAMFYLGELADRWGVRRALTLALSIMICGRMLLAAGGSFLTDYIVYLTYAGLGMVVIGYGMYQPAAYAAVRKFTNKKTSAMGYAMIYALMNFGAFFSGMLSPFVRRNTESAFPPNGISGVFWVYVGLTACAFIASMVILSKRAVAKAIISVKEADTAEEIEKIENQLKKEDEAEINVHDIIKPKLLTRGKKWFKEHPLANGKFSFFIFVLIPVQTLFAHNWLTLPLYIERSFVPWVSDNFEFFSNINPLLIFVFTPIVAGLTAKVDVYKMMVWGTLVMATPTFLLVIGPHPALLIAYLLLMSIGEAMWQPRFLQLAAEIAPEGKTGIYMGVAQFPWFLTKMLTAFYSGWFLKNYCPAEGDQNTSLIWLVYACIAMVTPIALIMAKGWMGKSLNKQHT
ncbi:MAG: peptide MFS transporter [bacterium]|nr:peptide MFS transporter [bacterium]